MAKRRVIVMPSPIEWVEPPVTKEDALNRGPLGTWERDGYDGVGGGQLPSEFALNEMVWPHKAGPEEQRRLDRSAKRQAEGDVFRDEALSESRDFKIDVGNLTGQDPGPPDPYKTEEK